MGSRGCSCPRNCSADDASPCERKAATMCDRPCRKQPLSEWQDAKIWHHRLQGKNPSFLTCTAQPEKRLDFIIRRRDRVIVGIPCRRSPPFVHCPNDSALSINVLTFVLLVLFLTLLTFTAPHRHIFTPSHSFILTLLSSLHHPPSPSSTYHFVDYQRSMADRELREYRRNILHWLKALPSNTPRYIQERFPIIKW